MNGFTRSFDKLTSKSATALSYRKSIKPPNPSKTVNPKVTVAVIASKLRARPPDTAPEVDTAVAALVVVVTEDWPEEVILILAVERFDAEAIGPVDPPVVLGVPLVFAFVL